MRNVVVVFLALLVSIGAIAQESNSLASTLDVFVFPAQGQDTGQQSTDEVACYEWAVGNTGSDPFDLADQAQVWRCSRSGPGHRQCGLPGMGLRAL